MSTVYDQARNERKALFRRHAGVPYCGLCGSRFNILRTNKKQCQICTFVYCVECTRKGPLPIRYQRMSHNNGTPQMQFGSRPPSAVSSATSSLATAKARSGLLAAVEERFSSLASMVAPRSSAPATVDDNALPNVSNGRLCLFCIEMECIGSKTGEQLRQLPVGQLNAFVEAFGLHLHNGTEEDKSIPFLEKGEIIRSITSRPAVSASAEARYRTKAPGYHFYILRHDMKAPSRAREQGSVTNFIQHVIMEKRNEGAASAEQLNASTGAPTPPHQDGLHDPLNAFPTENEETSEALPLPPGYSAYSDSDAQHYIPEMRRTYFHADVPVEDMSDEDLDAFLPTDSMDDNFDARDSTDDVEHVDLHATVTSEQRSRVGTQPYPSMHMSSSGDIAGQASAALPTEWQLSEASLSNLHAQPDVLSRLPMSVLRRILREVDVPYDDIIERAELQERVRVVLEQMFGDNPTPTPHLPSATNPSESIRNTQPTATTTIESSDSLTDGHFRTTQNTAAEQHLCKVCFDLDISVLFLECAHACTCTNCAASLSSCPICRRVITRKVKMYRA